MTTRKPAKTHRGMVEKWKKDPVFKAAYDELETEYSLLRALLVARKRAGLTQAQVAERMGTHPPAITRLETGLSGNRHSPTLATLKKYAEAVGCRIDVRVVPAKDRG